MSAGSPNPTAGARFLPNNQEVTVVTTPIRITNKKTGAAFDLHGPHAQEVLAAREKQGFVAVGQPLPSGAVQPASKPANTPANSKPTNK